MKTRVVLIPLFTLACSKPAAQHEADAKISASDASPDAAASTDAAMTSHALPLTCAVTTSAFEPALCPTPASVDGQATFCYRPQWPGVTSIDVLGEFGQATDWTQPFTTLANHGDGTWQATVSLANGSYPYIFQVTGSTDGVIGPGAVLMEDPNNPVFVKSPANAPGGSGAIPRSASQLTVPQSAASIYHVTGTVTLNGSLQPCFIAEIEIGEILNPNGTALAEHRIGNYVEIGADGTFDAPVADGIIGVDIVYPFGLSTTYPDTSTTPSLGVSRMATTVAGADVPLATTDMTYPTSAYAAMTPTFGGSGTAPVSLAWTLVPGASGSFASFTVSDVAGDDPGFTTTTDGALGSATTGTWDGTISGKAVAPGTYYWGTWQLRGMWKSESLLFPFTLN